MNTLPTKREPSEPAPVDPVPTWRDLRERFRDLMRDFFEEGKEIERELEPRLLPALKRLKTELERLIAKVEERAGKKPR